MTIQAEINGSFVEHRDHPLRGLAAQDMRGNTDESEYALLRCDENVEQWLLAIKELRRDVETQFAERKIDHDAQRAEVKAAGVYDPTWPEYQREYYTWRKRAMRMLTSAKDREAEARHLVEDLKRRRHEEYREHFLRPALAALKGFIEDDANITDAGREERDKLL